MWKKSAVCMSIIAFLLAPVTAMALPPIALVHSYQGYTVNGGKYVLSFKLMVQNPTDATVSGIVLKTAPLNWLMSDAVTLSIGDLSPRAETAAAVSLVTDRLPSERELQELPLLWECQISGQPAASLVESHRTMEGGQS